MNTLMVRHLRKNLIDFLEDRISLQEFNRWFIPYTWNMDHNFIVSRIKLRLCEYDSGYWTQEELKEILWEVV